MAERKLPRSGLSEILRKKADSVDSVCASVAGNGVGVLRRISFGREEIGCEIKQIFSNNNFSNNNTNRNSIFGCSPPVRARNPVVSDSKFWRETNRVEKLIEGGKIDSGLKDGLEKVVGTLSPPGRCVYNCNSNVMG